MKLIYGIGFAYLALCALVHVVRPNGSRSKGPASSVVPNTNGCTATQYGSESAKRWYCSVKPYCNSVEAADRLRTSPPPTGWDGAGYAAACHTLAGRIDAARQTLDAVAKHKRRRAVTIVFDIAHPVADRGDDVAAGPIMHLVLEYWPNFFQALYHAGMSDYALGKNEHAIDELTRFRRVYPHNDWFGQQADRALDRLARGLGPDKPNPGAH